MGVGGVCAARASEWFGSENKWDAIGASFFVKTAKQRQRRWWHRRGGRGVGSRLGVQRVVTAEMQSRVTLRK